MRHINFKTASHVVMLSFAVASLDNVHKFFAHAGHDGLAAWALAVALGAALVTLSIMLTHVDRDSDHQAFVTLAITAVAVGVLSGSLQTIVYLESLSLLTAALLGYGVPLVGEVLLAFAVSAYEKAQSRAAYRNVGQLVEGAIAVQLSAAVETFDGSAIQRHVETTINKLAKQSVNHVANKALSFYQSPQLEPGVSEMIERSANAETYDTDVREPELNRFADIQHLGNLAKSNGKQAAVERTIEFFRTNPNASLSDAEEYVGRKKSTISGYLDELEAAGRVYVNGSIQVKY